MNFSRWTEAFLKDLRTQGDSLADTHVHKMIQDKEISHIGELFQTLNSNDDTPAQDHFPAVTEFCNQTGQLPANVDYARLKRAEKIFMRTAFPAALVLLTKSLPEGYAAPNLSIILNISKNLEREPYRRLLQVLQMLLNVCAPDAFQKQGKAIITAQKIRLLHAGIRIIANKKLPDYQSKFGTPVNHEDMLATLMAFSLLVIKGLEILNCALSKEEAEDYFYLWRVYALLMGIHPEGEPENMTFIPDNVDDAEDFYDKYAQVHYTGPEQNPD